MVRYNTKISKDKPYYYKGHIRCFPPNLTRNELVWHIDIGNRFIKIISGESWYLQFDNKIPTLLTKNKVYKIPSAEYHRIINLGNSTLQLSILQF